MVLRPTHPKIPNIVSIEDRHWWLIQYFKAKVEVNYNQLKTDYYVATCATQRDINALLLETDLNILYLLGKLDKTHIRNHYDITS